MLEGDANRYLTWTQSAAEQAPCFWMGDMDAVNTHKVPKDYLVRLPFPTCWFEGEAITGDDGTKAIIGMLATEIPGTSYAVEALVFMRYGGRWALMLASSFNHDAEVGVMNADHDVISGTSYAMYALKVFCSAINCTNVEKREHAPDAALQKARTKKGKAPIFSYWTLEIKGRSDGGSVLGGTHADHRVHLCRGHIKRRKTGNFWWQPHVRGNKKLGMVHKDYNAAPTLLAAAQ